MASSGKRGLGAPSAAKDEVAKEMARGAPVALAHQAKLCGEPDELAADIRAFFRMIESTDA